MSDGANLSKEQLEQIKRDAEEAKKAKDAELAKAKQEGVESGKQSANQEHEAKKQLEEAQKAKEELEKKLADEKKAFEDKQAEFQKQLDELKGSKVPVEVNNPFKQANVGNGMSRFSPEQLTEIEEASRDLFMQERVKGR